MTLIEQKQSARKAASKIRKDAAVADNGAAPMEMLAHLNEALILNEGLVVSGFLPIGTEIDTRPILAVLRDKGLKVCLPCVEAENAPLTFRSWHPDDVLVKERFGTMAPLPEAEELQPDIILCPMLSFDNKGYRLGYGGGFYDRTLEKLRKEKPVLAIGVAYAAQEVDSVPCDTFDQPLDMILTEKEVMRL